MPGHVERRPRRRSPRPRTPRIPPLAEADRDEDATELIAQAGGPAAGAAHIFATLVRHPGLFRKWLPFGGKLLLGKLPARDRELLILRTGWNAGPTTSGPSASHRQGRGRTDEGIERISMGAEGRVVRVEARLVGRRTNARGRLHQRHHLGGLAERYDEVQLIELTMVVGHYPMVTFMLDRPGRPDRG